MNKATDMLLLEDYSRSFQATTEETCGSLTERLEIINRRGKKLIGYLDPPTPDDGPAGVVLVAPGYGETKEHNLLLASYLTANHFYSLRFDWSDHVGESQGDVFASTLTTMERDLFDLLDYVAHRFPAKRLGLFANSLAARVAIKVTSQDKRINFLVCLTPIVNLRETLKIIYREDLFENYNKGKRFGTIDMLGLSIHADNFLSDASESYANLFSTQLDAQKISIPTIFVVGQRDSWVRMSDIKAVLDSLDSREKELVVVPTALHRLLENPGAAEAAIRGVLTKIIESTTEKKIEINTLRTPERRRLEAQTALEKKHLRDQYEYSQARERLFWKEYLSNFSYVFNVPDFYLLLEAVQNRLGGLWPGQKILDAGCGLGNFGLYLLTKRLYRTQQDFRYASQKPVEYYGLDFVPEALREASCRIGRLRMEFQAKTNGLCGDDLALRESFVLADLETGIPFRSEFFDQVCCNLVISYLQDPLVALKEFWRVLRPGGRMVLSSLKPNADLSEIYRNFVGAAESPTEIQEGRQLLSNAGMIKLKEVVGLYHFYSEKELRSLVRKVGFCRARTFRSFGNQANLIACFKTP